MAQISELAAKRVEERARCRHDKLYLAEILGYDFQPDPHVELFACFTKYDPAKSWDAQDETHDRLILWPRGHYKTTAIVVEAIQAIINFPNIRILLMQGSMKVTKTLLHQILTHFIGQAEGSRFSELFPEFCGLSRKDIKASALEFTTPARTRKQLAQATVTVASPRSVKSGQHYELGLFDDLVNDSNYRNSAQLEKVREDFTLAQSLVDPGGYRIVTGTRYAFGDLYEQIIRWQSESGKWVVSVKNCWTDDTQKVPDVQKKPRFPKFTKRNGERGGFTTEYLLQMQQDDPPTFACQMLNLPVHVSQQAYTPEMLYGAVVTAEDAGPLSTPILVIDLASSEAIRADDSVIQAGAVDTQGIAYVCDQRGGQWAPMELALNTIDMVLRHRPIKVMLEKSSTGQVFGDYLRLVARQKGIYLPLEFIKIDTRPDAKNMRVVGLAGVVRRGRFKFFAGLTKFEKLVEQACEFPKGRNGHDDWIDTSALLYVELTKMLLELPVRQTAKTTILAMMAERENALMRELTQDERQTVDMPDMTGLN